MEKHGRHWKTHLLTFVVRIIAGRCSKRHTVRVSYSANEYTDTSPGTAKYTYDPHTVDVITEAVLLLLSVLRHAIQDLGTGEAAGSSEENAEDFPRAFERAAIRIPTRTGATSRADAAAAARRACHTMWGKALRWVLAAAPPVPSSASDAAYEVAAQIAIKVRTRMGDRGRAQGEPPVIVAALPEFELLLEKWRTASRPDTYTRTLASIIRGMKGP